MNSLLVLSVLIISIINIINCEDIHCNYAINGDCGPCMNEEICSLSCAGWQKCKGSTNSLTCKTDQDCHVDCDGLNEGASCQDTIINALDANNLSVDCHKYWDCKGITVNVGIMSDVSINCKHEWQGHVCQDMTVNAANANNVIINCEAYQSCKFMNITCGNGDCIINCNSSQTETCSNMALKCGTGKCQINCLGDVTNTRCKGISIDTTLATSFQCIGDTNQCIDAPPSFTENPTSTQMASDATTSVSSTTSTITIETTKVATTTVSEVTGNPTSTQTTSDPTTYISSTAFPVMIETTKIATSTVSEVHTTTTTAICNNAFIASIWISFDYIENEEDITTEQINNILVNVTSKFIEDNIITDDINCVLNNYYNIIEIKDDMKAAVINLTVCFKCNNQDTILIVDDYNNYELQKDFVDIFDEETTILKVIADSIVITTIIKSPEGEIQETTSIPIMYDNDNAETENNNDNLWSIMGPMLVIIIVCVGGVVFFYIYKMKKGYNINDERKHIRSSIGLEMMHKNVENDRDLVRITSVSDIKSVSNSFKMNDSTDMKDVGEDETGTNIIDSIQDTDSNFNHENQPNTAGNIEDDEFIINDNDGINGNDTNVTYGGPVIDDAINENLTDPPTEEGEDDGLIINDVNTSGDFKQNLDDKQLGNDLLMDDIIQDIEKTPQ